MGYPPVVVVESGGVPRTQVAEGVSAPAFTVVESGARPITLADNCPPIALFNEDGTPYTGVGDVVIPLGTTELYSGWDEAALDLWVIAGQSNGYTGAYVLPSADRVKRANILARMRMDSAYSGQISYAAEPFESEGTETSKIGFAKSFAENLLAQRSDLVTAPILLSRYNIGGTGFSNTAQPNWVKGAPNSLYDTMITNVLALIAANPQLRLRGMLWHQGEEDNGAYTDLEHAAVLDQFIVDLRADLGVPDLPIVFGGMSPDTVAYNTLTTRMAAVQDRNEWLGFFDPRANGQSGYPGDTATGAIGISDEASIGATQDAVHFSGKTQRENIGPRYTKGWIDALTHNNPGGADDAYAVPDAIADLDGTADDSRIDLTFTSPANNGAVILGYDVQVQTDGVNWIDAPKRLGSGKRLSGLTNGSTYKVRIRAFNLAGAAAWSNEITKTVDIVYETETDAFVARMGTAPNAALKVAINNFILGCKTDSNWARLESFYFWGLHTEADSLLDWMASRAATKSGSPTHTPGVGFTPAATTDSLRTGVNPGDGGSHLLTQNSVFIGVGSLGNVASSNPDMGTASIRIIARNVADAMQARLNDAVSAGPANANRQGRFYARRNGTTTKEHYKDGVSLGNTTQSTSAVASSEIYGLRANGSSNGPNVGQNFLVVGAGTMNVANLDARIATLISEVAAALS